MGIKVTQIRGLIAQPAAARRVIYAMGLGRISSSNILPDNNCSRGMINKVTHLVKYEVGVTAKDKSAKSKKASAKSAAISSAKKKVSEKKKD